MSPGVEAEKPVGERLTRGKTAPEEEARRAGAECSCWLKVLEARYGWKSVEMQRFICLGLIIFLPPTAAANIKLRR